MTKTILSDIFSFNPLVAHIEDKVREGCFRWFVNVLHRPPNVSSRKCEPGQSRPKISWKEVISKDLQSFRENKTNWKQKIHVGDTD